MVDVMFENVVIWCKCKKCKCESI